MSNYHLSESRMVDYAEDHYFWIWSVCFPCRERSATKLFRLRGIFNGRGREVSTTTFQHTGSPRARSLGLLGPPTPQ